MSNTEKFLKEAFAGESQANRKYSAFAAKADKEGFAQAAKLFRAAAAAEEVHAVNHLRVLKGIKSTKENMLAAISGEDEEWEAMYPEMIETAQAEGNKAAETSFHYANEVEKIHSQLYRKLLDKLEPQPGDLSLLRLPLLRQYRGARSARCLSRLWCRGQALHESGLIFYF